MLYFAYGSHMDPQQMERNCPNYQYIGMGELKDYHLGVFLSTLERDKSVLGVTEAKGKSVWGVMYEINDHHLKTLDEITGYNKDLSEKIQVEITMKKNTFQGFTYLYYKESTEKFSLSYKNTILSGAAFWNLSASYIHELKGMLENL